MLGWLRSQPKKARKLAERVAEALMEIGVLLVAFAPLDAVLGPGEVVGAAVLFAAAGILLFAIGVTVEWRFAHDG